MCSNTKQRIADAVEELISAQPRSRVTVQQVMELTQMNRQSVLFSLRGMLLRQAPVNVDDSIERFRALFAVLNVA